MKHEVAELFHKLADLTQDEQARYFEVHSVDESTLVEVQALLAHDHAQCSVLDESLTVAVTQELLRQHAIGLRCGVFKLASLIGRGGMGVVYFAQRADGLVTQNAAVKLLHPGWTEVERERFLQEREILARLTHPNIAHFLDAGHLGDGQPYFAMEYVEGQPIDRHCEGLTLRHRVELFLKVCGAVEYLHRNQIVHRDLKPGNIMVTAAGEPKLLDFGISKLLSLNRDLTATHARVLTPNYASPEQISGGAVGPTSDVYSLGALLHTLLTGKLRHTTGPGRAPLELKGDLGLILQKAMRASAQERYLSVEEFADDLKAFLSARPIRARKGERAYRLNRFVRRHRVPAALIGAFALAIMAVGFSWYWYQQRALAGRTLRPERLTANTNELPVLGAGLSPDGKSIAYSDPLGIHLRDVATGVTRLLPRTAGHVFVQWQPDSAGLQTDIEDAGGVKMMQVFPSGRDPVRVAASERWVVSPDKRRSARASVEQDRILLADGNGGDQRAIWKAKDHRTLIDFKWSPDSKKLGVISSRADVSALEIVNVVGGEQLTVLHPERQKLWMGSLVWMSQNRIILSSLERVGAAAYNSNLWEVRLGAVSAMGSVGLRRLTEWTDFPIRPGSLSTDGKRVVFIRSFDQRDVYVAEIDRNRSRLGPPRRLTLDLGDDYPTAWTPDSKSVLLASDRDGPINIFRQDLDKQTAEPLVRLPGVQILPRLAPDRKSVLFCNVVEHRACRLMSVPLTGGAPRLLTVVEDIGDVRCSKAGSCVVAQRKLPEPGYVVFELDLRNGKRREIYRDQDGHAGSPDISPDGKWLAAALGTKVLIRSFSTGKIVRNVPAPGATNLVTLDYSPDGKGIFLGDLTATESRQFYLDLSGKATLLSRQPGDTVTWGIPSPDGRYLAMLRYTIDSNVYTVEDL